MLIEEFFDSATSTLTYLVADEIQRVCAVIDSVLDFDPASGRTSTRSADRVIARVRELQLSVEWILETHVHADHLTAAQHLKEAVGGRSAVSSRITEVQAEFGRLFNAGPSFAVDGSQFDRLLADGDTFSLGSIKVQALHTPGHTPACVSYVMTHGGRTAAFVGDTMFMPDSGTARCDFPGGDARVLYRSIHRVLELPETTEVYTCHDYQPGGRDMQFKSTVGQQRAVNMHVRDGIDESSFVEMRQARDATLSVPALLLPSIQVNMRGGRLPEPDPNGACFLKIPVNAL